MILYLLLASLTLNIAKAEAPSNQLTTEITDQNKDSNSVFIAPISPPKTYKTDCELYRSIIEQYDWDWNIAYQIMKLESNCNPNALNNNPATGDYSVGLFQINIIGGLANERPSEQWLKNPENNIAYAYDLYTQYGWRIWTTYSKIK